MQDCLQTKESQTGVTMIEMLVVMTIMAILLAIGVPNMTDFFRTNRLDAATNELVAALNLARSEAIRRGTSINLVRAGTTASDWTPGWAVQDPSSNTIRAAASAAPLTIVARNFAANVTFDARGQATTAGLFLICEGGNVVGASAITVNAAGRVRVDRRRNAAPRDDGNTALADCSAP